jgi:hypothetical protein
LPHTSLLVDTRLMLSEKNSTDGGQGKAVDGFAVLNDRQ